MNPVWGWSQAPEYALCFWWHDCIANLLNNVILGLWSSMSSHKIIWFMNCVRINGVTKFGLKSLTMRSVSWQNITGSPGPEHWVRKMLRSEPYTQYMAHLCWKQKCTVYLFFLKWSAPYLFNKAFFMRNLRILFRLLINRHQPFWTDLDHDYLNWTGPVQAGITLMIQLVQRQQDRPETANLYYYKL
jgi:hypothetical protein